MRGQDQYSPDLLIPERHDYSTSDPSDFPNQDQPRGITIDGELVADVPAAANGISIEEPQFV
ncbi:MAG: hypothetical protein ABSG96_25415, partial [Terracidiphilus sp.]